MRTLLIPLLALAFAASPTAAQDGKKKKGALGSLEDQAGESFKPKAATTGAGSSVLPYSREHWSSLAPKEWAACADKAPSKSVSTIKSKDANFQYAKGGSDDAPKHYLCLAGAWLEVDAKPKAVGLTKDGREAMIVIPKHNFSRVRAQDIKKDSKALKEVAWMRADLFLETEASNPIELFLEPKTGLAGNGVALALESLAETGLLGDSAFKDSKNRKRAENWVNKIVRMSDEKSQARLYTRESSMATATGDVYKSGIELFFKREMTAEPQHISEKALLEPPKKK